MRTKKASLRHALALVAVAATVTFVPMGAGTAQAAPGAAAAASGPDCGTAVAKSTGGSWTCTFADEFSSFDTTKWMRLTTAESGYHINKDCYTGSTDNTSVSNGALRLTVRKQSPFTCKSPSGNYTTQYTSGMASSYRKFSQAYGRFEIRAKLPATKVAGQHSAFWLWPDNPVKYGGYPNSGEIDVAEFYTKYPDRVIPYVHYNDGYADPNVTNNYCLVTTPENWHTYVVEWTTTKITILYDGKVCIDDTWQAVGLAKPAPFDQPFFINLTQGIGLGANAPTAATTFPATMYVDYVHVWK